MFETKPKLYRVAFYPFICREQKVAFQAGLI